MQRLSPRPEPKKAHIVRPEPFLIESPRRLDQRTRRKMLAHHLRNQTDYLLGEIRHPYLLLVQPRSAGIRLNLLRTQRLPSVRRPPQNVADPRDAVAFILHPLLHLDKLVEDANDLLERQQADLPLDAALLGKHGPLIDRDQFVLDTLIEQPSNLR